MSQLTNCIDVSVEVVFSPAHSSQTRLVYVYFITMHNRGLQSARLLRRHFFICDGLGAEQEIEGEGVVGQHPQLEVEQTYRYHSIVPIRHPPGSMRGDYTFLAADGQEFKAELPEFILHEPPGYIPSPRLETGGKRVLN